MWWTELIGYLPRIYRDDPWINALFQTGGAELDAIAAGITELHGNRYLDTFTFALPIWERILGMRPAYSQGDDSRRAALRAKWLTNRKSDRLLLQEIADSWQPGTVTVGFEDGYITLTADGNIAHDWRHLLAAIHAAKPAHLPLIPVLRTNSTLYIGGALMPSYTQTVLPQWSPERKLRTSATVGGMVCSTITIQLPPMEVI